jgi:hypothetical protein
MKYDDASWHYGGDFPKDLPDEAGATHTGMFLAWALLQGLGGDLHTDEMPEEIENLRQRNVTPGQFFLQQCDGKLTDEDFSDGGNRFVEAYFDFTNGKYLADYEATVGAELPSLYYVPDSWASFDALAPVLDRRLREWRAGDG